MPLFSKNDERNGEANGDNTNGQPRSHSREDEERGEQPPPDEHTRLLPNRLDSNRGLLQPDDPAVSPYNLWSIRILRYITILFTFSTFIWWILLLVSAFATPPGFHTRGSGFLSFGYATLTLATLFCSLLFFNAPAKTNRILAIFMAGVLLLDMIILLAVAQTRYEEGWVGTASVIWALLMSLWILFTDRMVKWGKAEEEERLTGRAETRRTLFEWSEVMLSTIAYSIMSVAIVLITLGIILRALDAGYGPPGKLHWVDDEKYRIHIYCNGNKTNSVGETVPTILFEGGERPVESLWDFAENGLKNGSFSRYCFADRPGLGWSDTAPSPLSAGFATDVLSEALVKAGEKGPWVLASAGIGSVYSRVFSSRHGGAIKGILLIDPLHEDLLGEVGRPGRGFLLWLRGVISPLGLDRLPGAIFRGRSSKDRVYGCASQQTGKVIFAKLQESLVAGSFTKRDVDTSREIQRRNVPLVVISSGDQVNRSKKWNNKQRDLTKITDNLVSWDVVNKAPHEVWRTYNGRQKIEKRLKELVRNA